MVNHTKLIRTLTISCLRNNTKRWLSTYLKGRTASCRYNSTLSPSFHARVGVPQGYVYLLLYCTSLSPHPPNPKIFSPAPMLMASLFPIPTPTLTRLLWSFLPTHQILRSGQMSWVFAILLKNPPSIYSPLNLQNLPNILKSI